MPTTEAGTLCASIIHTGQCAVRRSARLRLRGLARGLARRELLLDVCGRQLLAPGRDDVGIALGLRTQAGIAA